MQPRVTDHYRRRRRIWFMILSSAVALLHTASIQRYALAGYYDGFSNVTDYHSTTSHDHNVDDGDDIILEAEVAQCTPRQLSTIRKQLPPDDCVKHQNEPWTQRCSLTYATRCPDAIWLENHYAELHRTRSALSNLSSPGHSFLGISVGCNKGFDAVNAMRMGSGNPTFDKVAWEDAMTDTYKKGVPHGKVKLATDVCNQATSSQFSLPPESDARGSNIAVGENGARMHCIEPVPSTYKSLSRAAYKLKYDKMGFVVTHAAVSRGDGLVAFPRETARAGRENAGIDTVRCLPQMCVNVTAYGLDSYVSKYVLGGAPIDYLSVDVEGHDYDVLMGGGGDGDRNGSIVLERVRYLEFEYNWMGPWKGQSLRRAVEHLDRRFGFTCYWAGFNNTIWRITRCWMDYYDLHFWSNVACVNRNAREVRRVARGMESLFLDTLEKGEENVRDFEHRFRRSD